MSIHRDRINTCVAKIAYPTRLEAEMARIALLKKHRGKDKLHLYRCSWCSMWHLGRIRRKHGALVESGNHSMAWKLDWSNCYADSFEQEV